MLIAGLHLHGITTEPHLHGWEGLNKEVPAAPPLSSKPLRACHMTRQFDITLELAD